MYNIDLHENKLIFSMNNSTDRFAVQRSRGAIQNIASMYNTIDICYRDEELGGVGVGARK
jgi:hypothetical protein